MKHVGPDLTDIVDLAEGLEARITKGIGHRGRRVREAANASGVIGDKLAHSVVPNHPIGLFGPFRQRVRPAFAQATGLNALQAASGATASEAVGDPVSHLVDDDVVFEGTVAEGVGKVPQEHTHDSELAIGRRCEVGVVGARGILDRNEDRIAADAT